MAVPIKGIKGIKAIKKSTSPIKGIKTSTSDAKARRRGSSRMPGYRQQAAINSESWEWAVIPSPSTHLPNNLQKDGEADGCASKFEHGDVSDAKGLIMRPVLRVPHTVVPLNARGGRK